MKLTEGIKNAVIEAALRKGLNVELKNIETNFVIPDDEKTKVNIKIEGVSIKVEKGENK